MNNFEAFEEFHKARKDGRIRSVDVRHTIREAGIITLTGEACALSQRMLCDLTARGVELLLDYWGLPAGTRLQRNYNSSDGQIASCYIDHNSFTDIAIFYLRRRGESVVYVGTPYGYKMDEDGPTYVRINTSIYTIDMGDHDSYHLIQAYHKDIDPRANVWYKQALGSHDGSGQARRGASNVQAFSGRWQ